MKKQIKQSIMLSSKEILMINNLLKLTGDEIYQKYGLKRDEVITHTSTFPDGTEADIKLVICEGEEKPYTEGVLLKNGVQLSCTDCEDTYTGIWEFETEDIEYIVYVMPIAYIKVYSNSRTILEPLEDYLDSRSHSVGFGSYEELKEAGYSISLSMLEAMYDEKGNELSEKEKKVVKEFYW